MYCFSYFTPGAPLAGFIVRAFDPGVGREPEDVGYDVTSADGLLALACPVTPGAFWQQREEDQCGRRLRLHVLDPRGKEIHQTDVVAKADPRQVIEVRVPVPMVMEPWSPAATNLIPAAGWKLLPELLQEYRASPR
jgi:hypothetical protein